MFITQVAARRIAEGAPNAQVLRIEAGPRYRSSPFAVNNYVTYRSSNLNIINSRMAMGWQNIPFSVCSLSF